MLSRAPTDKATSNEIPEGQIFQIQSFLSDLDIANPLQDIPVSAKTYQDIREATQGDSELQAVKLLIIKGWPSKLTDIQRRLQPYFHARDQLAVLDGVIYKGSQLIIPVAYRPNILNKLHTSHQGVAATLRRARSCVYWPEMSEDVRRHIERCTQCAMDAPLQKKETLRNHEIPATPWTKVGMDLFTFKNRDYLVIVDYFTNFFEWEHLKEISTKSVIKACKKTFARYGIPVVVQSDNGPQFTAYKFMKFSEA
jgi:hypothetical protein